MIWIHIGFHFSYILSTSLDGHIGKCPFQVYIWYSMEFDAIEDPFQVYISYSMELVANYQVPFVYIYCSMEFG